MEHRCRRPADAGARGGNRRRGASPAGMVRCRRRAGAAHIARRSARRPPLSSRSCRRAPRGIALCSCNTCATRQSWIFACPQAGAAAGRPGAATDRGGAMKHSRRAVADPGGGPRCFWRSQPMEPPGFTPTTTRWWSASRSCKAGSLRWRRSALVFSASAAGLSPRRTVIFILGLAAIMRAMLLFAPPHSTDIYRYVWDGRVQADGINPYLYIPEDPALAHLRDDGDIYPHINRRSYAPTIYPPAAQIVFAAVAHIAQTVTMMKAAMLAFEALAIGAILALLKARAMPLAFVALYAWHPLALWEVAGSGHVDIVGVALLLVSLLLAERGNRIAAGFALGAAFLAKYLPPCAGAGDLAAMGLEVSRRVRGGGAAAVSALSRRGQQNLRLSRRLCRRGGAEDRRGIARGRAAEASGARRVGAAGCSWCWRRSGWVRCWRSFRSSGSRRTSRPAARRRDRRIHWFCFRRRWAGTSSGSSLSSASPLRSPCSISPCPHPRSTGLAGRQVYREPP